MSMMMIEICCEKAAMRCEEGLGYIRYLPTVPREVLRCFSSFFSTLEVSNFPGLNTYHEHLPIVLLHLLNP